VERILARLEASDLVITAAGVTPERRNEIAALCRRAGVRLLNFQVQWDADPAPPGTPAALGGAAT
jgi:hypothetical protein